MKTPLFLAVLCCGTAVVAVQPPPRDLGPTVTARWESASCIAVAVRDVAMPAQMTVEQGGRAIAVQRVSLETRLVDLIPKGWPYKPVTQNVLFVHLERAADETNAVRVFWQINTPLLTLPALRDSAVQCLQVNSIGYQPADQRKTAMLGGWTGTSGPLVFGGATAQFFVVDERTHASAYAGTPRLLATNDPESGACAYELDFSPLTATGRYQVYVPGVGYSVPFGIADAVYAPVLRELLRGLYHQRCGIAIGPPYTTHSHAACHRSTARLVDFYDSMDDVMWDLPNHVIEPEQTIDGWGGWHDAGDYDRAGWHISVAMSLLDAYTLCPSNFPDGQSNIPESGNGIPDILDEVRWGLQWFMRMQDTNDGGLFYRIETVDYGSSLPEDDAQQLYAMAKYPKHTCYFAAGAAQAARVLRPFISADERADLLQRAERAYAYARPRGAPSEAVSQAAAELFLATGNAQYHQDFLNTGMARSWSYAMAPASNLNAAAQQACRTYFINNANAVRAEYDRHVYPCGVSGMGVGAGRDAATLARAYALTGSVHYLTAARRAVHAQLGLNALRRCWITGLGVDPPEEITHAPSTWAGGPPVPGIPIFGPHPCSSNTAATHARLLWLVSQPKPYPWLRLWAPVWEIPSMCEFTVRDIAEIIVGYATLCAAGPVSNQASSLLLDGLPVYDFDTDTLNGWSSGAHGAAAWDSANKVLGTGAMRIDVTNMLGNWANAVAKDAALDDAPWALNSNLVAWMRASSAVWPDYLRPCLVMTVGGSATNLRYELSANGLSGHVLLDDAWHPYVYAYHPAWLTNALWLSLAYEVTTTGAPTGRVFYVDNVRLLPGNVPEPVLALLACLSLLTLSLRNPINQGTLR